MSESRLLTPNLVRDGPRPQGHVTRPKLIHDVHTDGGVVGSARSGRMWTDRGGGVTTIMTCTIKKSTLRK